MKKLIAVFCIGIMMLSVGCKSEEEKAKEKLTTTDKEVHQNNKKIANEFENFKPETPKK